jgi:redox-sensitive bicupin YhaK (pirin superfamily)
MGDQKTIVKVTGPRGQHWVGNGFNVRQMFGYNDLGRDLSPFLLMDYAGPTEFAPAGGERRGVGAHPHRGFETVTIVYQGGVEHRDSVGNHGEIGPGDVQWMTAGTGVLHEEMHSSKFSKTGGIFELVQLWVNLPAKQKLTAPNYQTLTQAEIPRVSLAGEGGFLRVVAGEFLGSKGPAKTHTAIDIWDIALGEGANSALKVPEGHTCAIFCLKGEVLICNKELVTGPKLIIFDSLGAQINLHAKSAAKLLFLGGLPLNEPMVGLGPFVMNTDRELEQAFKDYEAGRFGSLD